MNERANGPLSREWCQPSHNLLLSNQRWLAPRCPGGAGLAQRAALRGRRGEEPASRTTWFSWNRAGQALPSCLEHEGGSLWQGQGQELHLEGEAVPEKGGQEGGGKGKEVEGTWRGPERDWREMKVLGYSGLYLRGQGSQEAQ